MQSISVQLLYFSMPKRRPSGNVTTDFFHHLLINVLLLFRSIACQWLLYLVEKNWNILYINLRVTEFIFPPHFITCRPIGNINENRWKSKLTCVRIITFSNIDCCFLVYLYWSLNKSKSKNIKKTLFYKH